MVLSFSNFGDIFIILSVDFAYYDAARAIICFLIILYDIRGIKIKRYGEIVITLGEFFCGRPWSNRVALGFAAGKAALTGEVPVKEEKAEETAADGDSETAETPEE